MLFTGKGDDGQTNLYGPAAAGRVSKTSPIFSALGAVDELNSWLGLCRARLSDAGHKIGEQHVGEIILGVQQNLFIIQAELAGADKSIKEEKVKEMEKLIREVEDLLPPIKSFVVPGATEPSALLDYARALARRTEREVLKLGEEYKISQFSRAYLNRLSSLLYALARLSSRQGGAKEESPHYR